VGARILGWVECMVFPNGFAWLFMSLYRSLNGFVWTFNDSTVTQLMDTSKLAMVP